MTQIIIATIAFVFCLNSCNYIDSKNEISPKYVLVIHGGAGTILKENLTPEKRATIPGKT